MADRDETARRLDEVLVEAEARLDRIEAVAEQRLPATTVVPPPVPPAGPAASTHVAFVPSPSGYALVERAGAAPAPGETVELSGFEGSYAVVKVVGSPLPEDRRSCVYLELI